MSDFSVILRALVESGSVTAAVVLAVVWVLHRTLHHLGGVGPGLIRAANEHVAVRRALKAKTKPERDQAYRVLQLLRDQQLPPPSTADPPENITS